MKAQDLRDKLAGIRSFSVLIDGKKIEEVVTDIANSKVYLLSEKMGSTLPVEDENYGQKLTTVIDGNALLSGNGGGKR